MSFLKLTVVRRVTSLVVAVAGTIGLSLVIAQPAHADPGAWGNIDNRLPAAWPVKIAEFGVGGSHRCSTRNAGSFTCREYWLPSGKSDSDIRGFFFDTDGFQVENVSRYYVSSYGWVPGDVWFKIEDYHEVRCTVVGGAPYCQVDIV
ncbi:hypothetical protein [Kibdelosporangium aridum]|uniref:hypothetical protein n=1 Tax=Kibdelosporangium aridum TaxID=2030 RepID=UPI0036D3868D